MCTYSWLHEKVSLSSLNRHAVATRADVGIPKAECLKKHFSSIFPECQIDAKVLLYDVSSEEEILSGNPDFVLDCIDNIDTKVSIMTYELSFFTHRVHKKYITLQSNIVFFTYIYKQVLISVRGSCYVLIYIKLFFSFYFSALVSFYILVWYCTHLIYE